MAQLMALAFQSPLSAQHLEHHSYRQQQPLRWRHQSYLNRQQEQRHKQKHLKQRPYSLTNIQY